MRSDLRTRFLQFVTRKGLVRPEERVLVAVSGGIDSMVLLHLFNHCKAELGIQITAAHFDHAMRPGSAAAAQFVTETCRSWGVTLLEGRAPDGLRSEAQARDARYAFLIDAMTRADAHRIATAHHADDQVETVLFRLMRGAGTRGLSGIPVRRGPIIRPLLRFRKNELEAYAAANGIPFREDETNVDHRFARNRIRHILLPALKPADPEFSSQILRLARHAAGVERAWRAPIREARARVVTHRKNEVAELARGKLLEYDAEARARVLRSELRRFGAQPDRAMTDRMARFAEVAVSGARMDVGGGVQLQRAFDVLRITRTAMLVDEQVARIGGCAQGSADARIGGRSWRVEWTMSAVSREAQQFDCASLRFPLEVRGWRAGDRVRLAYGTKKLKKLFTEARVPVHARAQVPVLVDADGRVCWVVGVARSVEMPPPANGPSITIMVSDVENS